MIEFSPGIENQCSKSMTCVFVCGCVPPSASAFMTGGMHVFILSSDNMSSEFPKADLRA